MFRIALYEPEIPPNTGNIIRLCANTGAELHIIHPAAFSLDHSKLKRAGLDYREFASIIEHKNFEDFIKTTDTSRLFALTTKGKTTYSDVTFKAGDTFLFGPETRGLPANVLETLATNQVLRIPMIENSRSLNLSNTAALVIYEAWRQLGFSNAG